MKLLFDQNISHRVIAKITESYPGAVHVKSVGLIDASDTEIFLYARTHNFDAIVTIDSDLYDILQRLNAPPKVIWIRTGNISTTVLVELLLEKRDFITVFLDSNEYDCYEIFK